MSQNSHTPLPWITAPSWDDFTVVGSDGAEIIFQDGPHGTPTLTKDDAEFIVRACNAHYDILEALRVARDEMVNIVRYGDGLLNPDAISVLDAAIAKAKGESL